MKRTRKKELLIRTILDSRRIREDVEAAVRKATKPRFVFICLGCFRKSTLLKESARRCPKCKRESLALYGRITTRVVR